MLYYDSKKKIRFWDFASRKPTQKGLALQHQVYSTKMDLNCRDFAKKCVIAEWMERYKIVSNTQLGLIDWYWYF